MKKYIKQKTAEQAKPEFLNEKVQGYEKAIYAKGWNDCITQYRENILSTPAADVVEVRHGEWIVDDAASEHCSCCGHKFYISALFAIGGNDEPNCCPNCGAKMDGGERMSRYGVEDFDDMAYELDKFLEDHTAAELLRLVTDAVDWYEEKKIGIKMDGGGNDASN